MLSWESGSKVDRTLLKHCGAAKSWGIVVQLKSGVFYLMKSF